MQKVQVHKVGLVFGAFFGIVHLIWSLMIALGLAQGFMDFIFKLHMITPVYVIAPFSMTAALTLIIVTAIIGYIFGCVAAWLWNKLLGR